MSLSDEAWNNKGNGLYQLRKYEEAIGCCDKALDTDSRLMGAWLNKGAALNEVGKYEEAIECYDKSTQYQGLTRLLISGVLNLKCSKTALS